jgi:hypothetical protein
MIQQTYRAVLSWLLVILYIRFFWNFATRMSTIKILLSVNWLSINHVHSFMIIPFRRGVIDIKLCDKVCQWLAAGLWFSLGTLVSSTNKTDHHNITEILLRIKLCTWLIDNQLTLNSILIVDILVAKFQKNVMYSMTNNQLGTAL